MRDECLICGAPLEYLFENEDMECAICRKKEPSKTRCVSGHYVCSDCHTQGMDAIFSVCMNESSTDPIEILEELMSLPFCHMHGPEHHVIVGASLLTAYKNSGGKLDFESALKEIYSRGKSVPGGVCGFWGACGAGISSGQFVSIISGATPLSDKEWGLANKMTSSALANIGQIGGPRCCKRDSYISILSAVDFIRENFGIEMKRSQPACSRSAQNAQCITSRCPFHKSNNGGSRDE